MLPEGQLSYLHRLLDPSTSSRQEHHPTNPRPPEDTDNVNFSAVCDTAGSAVDPPVDPITHDQCYNWLHAVRAKKLSESSDDSTTSEPLPMPSPPDGGWGWFVVLGAFLVTMICDGVAFSFGVLYTELLAEFDTTRSMASLVGAVFFGVSMILGPLASSLTTRFGCRKMTIVGGLLSSLGFLACSFVNSIELLCLVFGVVIGAGFSCCYITSVVIVAFYFEERRALATGLAVCGTGVGTFSFAPLITYLINEFRLKGTFMILSGVCLNLVVCGMLFRPLKFSEVERRKLMLEEFDRMPHGQEEIEVKRSRYSSGDTGSSDTDSDDGSSEEDIKSLSTLYLPTFVAKSKVAISNDLLVEAVKNSKNPHHTMQRYMKNAVMRSEQTQITSETPPTKKMVKNDVLKPKEKLQLESFADPKRADLNHRTFSEKSSTPLESRGTSVHMGKHSALATQLPLYRNDIFYRPHQEQNTKLAPCAVSTSCPELTETGGVNHVSCYLCRKLKNICGATCDVLCHMIDVQLFKNKFFCILLMSNYMFYMWSDVPYMYAVDHAIGEGVDKERASFLVSVIGIANTVGQVFFGYIGDLDINVLNVYAIVSILAGAAIAVVPWIHVYWGSSSLYALFGFFVSVSSPLTTILLVRYLGMEKLTSAYGQLMFVQGVANLVGPPLAGFVSDQTGNYDFAFYLSGLFHAVSGLVLFLVYCQRVTRPPRAPTNSRSDLLHLGATSV